jgi:hypothetical protein
MLFLRYAEIETQEFLDADGEETIKNISGADNEYMQI